MKLPKVKQAAVLLEQWLHDNPTIRVADKNGRRIFRLAQGEAMDGWCFWLAPIVNLKTKYIAVGLSEALLEREAFLDVLSQAKEIWEKETVR